MLNRPWMTAALVLVLLLALPRPAAAQTDEDQVVAVAEALLAAITARDTTAFRALLLPEAQAIAVQMRDGGVRYRWRQVDADVRSLGMGDEDLLERMWAPEVHVSGPIASVWAPYDFYLDGQFSHCGIDAFQLVRTDAGWKIAAVLYTVVPEETACPPSPLGPPKP